MAKMIMQNKVFNILFILSLCILTGNILLYPKQTAYADPPVAADTAETMECEFTNELQLLAQELNHDSVEIYNWVYKNIKYDRYYYGSRMGAHTTYLNRRGNTWDICSLLITLLRISDIPARYIYINGSPYKSTFVYVEAWVPVDSYRGSGEGQVSDWIPLSPWNYAQTYKPGIDIFANGIPSALAFDFDSYVLEQNNKNPLEVFEEDVQKYLHDNYQGQTLKGIPFTETSASGSAPISSLLPGSLPENFTVSFETASEVPDSERVNITLRFKHATDDSILLEKSIYLPQVAGKRFCLDFIPVDETTRLYIIDNYDGNMCKVPPGENVYVKPALKLDGNIMSGGTGSQIRLNDSFYVEYIGGGYTTTQRPDRKAGTFMQIALDPLTASEKTIEKMKIDLKDLSTDIAYVDSTREEYLGRMANILTETFLLRMHNNASRIEDLMYGKFKWDSVSPTFIYTFPDNILKDEESKFYIHPQWNIDAQSNIGFVLPYNNPNSPQLAWTDPLFVLARKLSGYSASYNEGLIFEDWLDTPGLSTIKGLMVASEDTNNDVRVFTNTQADIDYLNGLKGSSDPNALSDSIIQLFIDEVVGGARVTAQTKNLVYKDYTGYVMISEGLNGDGYLFGQDNGGWTSTDVTIDPVVVATTSIPVNQYIPPSVNTSWIDNYTTVFNGVGTTTKIESNKANSSTVSASDGDPVDMAKGEYYQEEKPDIIIASRGIPLSVVRTYKNQLIYNGPFGFGWTWNHAERILPLEDDDVLYYDNQGISYELTHQGNGIYDYPPGSTFTLVTTTTSYIVTQKRSGHEYHFTLDGYLDKKIDRFGNELNFTHDITYPDRITEITDSLGGNRKLTLVYNPEGKVETVTDFTGRICRYTYTGDDLTTFTDLEQNDTKYEYLSDQENELNNHNMSKYIMPNGNFLELGYYLNDTVSWHRNEEGATFNFLFSRLNQYAETWNEEGYYRKIFFNDNNDVVRIAHKDGTISQSKFDEHHNMTELIDGNGNTTTFTYFPAGQPEIAADRNLYSKTNEELNETWNYKYDSLDNPYAPSEVTDPMGAVTNYEYYSGGSLHKKIQAPGFNYDADNKLVPIANAPGFATIYNYDIYGNLTSTTDPLGLSTSGTYDTDGLYLTSSTDKNGKVTNYTYYDGSDSTNPVGALSSATIDSPTDSSGITTSYTYNHYNQKTTITDDLGNTTDLNYDVNRKLLTRVLPDGATTTFSYYPARDIVSGALVQNETDALGNFATFKYDKTGNMTSREDRNGNITTYSYDGLNRLIAETDPFQNSAELSYDGNGNVVKQTDKNGNVTNFVYDAANRLITKRDPEGNDFDYEYYADGKLKNEIYTVNTTKVKTHYDYNALGHPEARTISNDDGSGDTREFQYRYDALGRLIKTIYPKGNYETIEYDYNGNTRYTRSFDSLGNPLKQVEFIYYADSRNLLQKKIVDNGKDDSGDGYIYEYDALGRLLRETDPVGNHVDYEYDSVGNLVRLTDGAGNITQHFYDLAGKKVKTIDANNSTTTVTYDNNGNPLKVTDREGNETTAFYDAMNRRIGVMDTQWNTTTFDYDENGNLIGLTDPNSGSTLYEYDDNNRQTKLIRPEGETTTFEYDPVGNRTAVLDANGQKIAYEHDQFGQLKTTKHYATGDHNTEVKTVNFDYDFNGNLTSYDDSITSADYTYDDLNRKTGETINYTATISKDLSYSYPDNWTQTFTGPDNVTLTHNYDAAGRLNTITIPGQGDITYNTYEWNSPTNIALPGGSSTDYSYDALWHVKAITTSDTDIMTRNYVYTAEGNITTKTTEHGSYTYTYDELYRLTDAVNPIVTDETYTYDNLGNRLTSAAVAGNWAYNLNNELSSYGGTTLTYDDNGNITNKAIGAVDTSYIYDVGDRMTEVKDDSGVPIIAYYYDPFGRRLWKNDGNGRIYYLYSDGGLIGEYDSSGVETKTYGYAMGSQWGTNPLFQKEGTTYYWYHNDHLGTPQKITDTSGTEKWSATYDSFGKATVSGTSTITNNLRFPGQYFDSETGLHYNWNRYYDSETGRYMRVDPIGEGLNLYLYVQNNPLKYIDPRGLTTRSYQNDYSYQQPAYTPTQSVSVTSNNQLDLGVPGGGSLYAGMGMADFDNTSSPTSNGQIEMGMPAGIVTLPPIETLVNWTLKAYDVSGAGGDAIDVIEANGIPAPDAWLNPYIESARKSIKTQERVQEQQDIIQELLGNNARDIPINKWLDMMKMLPESESTIKSTANEPGLWGGE